MRSVAAVSLALVAALLSSTGVTAWQPGSHSSPKILPLARSSSSSCSHRRATCALLVLKEDETSTPTATTDDGKSDIEETTEKYGLEAGLFQSLRQPNGSGGDSAKSLLKKYGIAYLATSIPLAVLSFGICYTLVSQGVDVSSLLRETVGIEPNAAAENAGTFAIAYAAHKAASPIRFPPTVILTPIVAKIIGKEEAEEGEGDV